MAKGEKEEEEPPSVFPHRPKSLEMKFDPQSETSNS